MMAATHVAAGMAGSFLLALFVTGLALFWWAQR
jgi:hypothetical protein